MMRAAAISCAAIGAAGCEPSGEVAASAPEAAIEPAVYEGVSTTPLGDDLVQFVLEMRGGTGVGDLTAYADCAAAQYAEDQGYGFARHLRTNVDNTAGLWRADAVYTISQDRPRGISTIEAASVAQTCRENGIPTV